MALPKSALREIAQEQFGVFNAQPLGVPRERIADVRLRLNSPFPVIITGLRRVGKSTIAAQMAHELGADSYYYLNFEDDRLADFRVSDFDALREVFLELFGLRRIFVFDEIQNIEGWEHFVRRLSDQGNRFLITGSNSRLLSQEFGSKLTGRNSPVELFPFSFG
jgi:uncharacterized protein